MSWAVWITGLPGSGKSAIARAVAARLRAEGQDVMALELDVLRHALTPRPTDTDEEREAVYRALVYIGATLVDAGTPVIFDATAHRRAWRDLARDVIGRFLEVQLICPLAVCREREATRRPGAAPVGICAQASEASARVPGVNVDYERARAPELTIDSASSSVAEAADAVVTLVRRRTSGGAAPGARRVRAHGLSRVLLEEGTPEQRAISDAAHAYLAEHAPRPAGERGKRRALMVAQIAGRGVRDTAVLAAMRSVPRDRFVPARVAELAYEDRALPIGDGQMMSRPCVVAAMTEALRLRPTDRVLEIGTGSGYATAVLASIAADVYTVEPLETLADAARWRLRALGYDNVRVRHDDGSRGWPEFGPYDAIVVTASGPGIPPALLPQLAVEGRLVMPIGAAADTLVRVVRTGDDTYAEERLGTAAFEPLVDA